MEEKIVVVLNELPGYLSIPRWIWMGIRKVIDRSMQMRLPDRENCLWNKISFMWCNSKKNIDYAFTKEGVIDVFCYRHIERPIWHMNVCSCKNKPNLRILMQQIVQQPVTSPLNIRIRLIKPSRIPGIPNRRGTSGEFQQKKNFPFPPAMPGDTFHISDILLIHANQEIIIIIIRFL